MHWQQSDQWNIAVLDFPAAGIIAWDTQEKPVLEFLLLDDAGRRLKPSLRAEAHATYFPSMPSSAAIETQIPMCARKP